MTFDRSIQTDTFGPSQVVSITGPLGTISGQEVFNSTGVNQAIPPPTIAGPGTLSSTVTVSSGGTLQIQNLSVSLSIGATSDAGLTAVLIAPNGTQVPLFSNLFGSNFINTVFDDTAASSITQGTAPYTGTFVPAYPPNSPTLSGLKSLKSADGTWTLLLTNTQTGATSTLDTWSLNINPVITVTPIGVKNVTIGGVSETVAKTFAIGFPEQELSGTYTIQLGANIEDEFGDAMDVSQTAGVNVLRGVDQNAPTTTIRYVASDLPVPIPPSTSTDTTGQPIPGSVSSSIVVPDSFIIEGIRRRASSSPAR